MHLQLCYFAYDPTRIIFQIRETFKRMTIEIDIALVLLHYRDWSKKDSPSLLTNQITWFFPPWSLDQLSLSTGDLFLSSDWLLSIVVSHLSVHDLLKPPCGWLAWELSTFCDADMDQVWKRIWQSLQSKRVYLWIYQRWTLRIESKDWVLRKQTSTLQTRCISCTYSFLILFLCGSVHFEKLGWEMRVIFSRYE